MRCRSHDARKSKQIFNFSVYWVSSSYHEDAVPVPRCQKTETTLQFLVLFFFFCKSVIGHRHSSVEWHRYWWQSLAVPLLQILWYHFYWILCGAAKNCEILRRPSTNFAVPISFAILNVIHENSIIAIHEQSIQLSVRLSVERMKKNAFVLKFVLNCHCSGAKK